MESFTSKTLQTYLKEAREHNQALGHFNFTSEDVLRAIVETAKEEHAAAVIVGTSEGEADYIGLTEAVALVGAIREEYEFPVFLNSDHFKSVEKCIEAINAGYDSIHIDASSFPYEENVVMTRKVVAHAKGVNPDISVEGELGYLRGSSSVHDEVIEISPDDYTKPDQAHQYLKDTNVDRLAIVFGNIHGIVSKQEEILDIEHLKKIVAVVPDVMITLHGASGLSDDDVRSAIAAGISNVHFNTELRVAYHEGLVKALKDKPDETTPYKYLGVAAAEVKEVVRAKLRLFTQA